MTDTAALTRMLETSMDEKNCATCAHRYGLFRSYWRCQAVGYYCSTEAKYPVRCGGGADWKMWQPRAPLHKRIIRIFTGVQPTSDTP